MDISVFAEDKLIASKAHLAKNLGHHQMAKKFFVETIAAPIMDPTATAATTNICTAQMRIE